MDLKRQLDRCIQTWALLRHPFYQAWESGQLPEEALKTYAREYGAFIRNLPAAWETLADAETAAEELEHAELWQDFAAGLQTQVGEPALPAVNALVSGAARLFASRAGAFGALYAFEAQQPETAKTKLAGLRKHYSLPASAEPYFEVHANNQHEAARLLAGLAALPAGEQAEALHACRQMSQALWDALTDIYNAHCHM
ncbi:MAG: iron-containing redox enzyme family protein [Anaerolineales bacterium]